ncbi:NUDIX domain-containing protein [Listeria kieliensis]
MRNLEEKTLREKTWFEGRVVKLVTADVELPDGTTGSREIVKHPGAVAILPICDSGKLLLVEQYRKPLEKAIVEIPAGKIEPSEDKEITAARELEEETGHVAGTLSYLTSFYTAPGFSDELLHIYVARDLKKLQHQRPLDEDEFVNILEVTLDEAKQLVEQQVIYDAKTVYAIQYLELENLKRQLEDE